MSSSESQIASCAHCGLPAPPRESGPTFCCYGCYLVNGITGRSAREGELNLLVAQLLVGVFFSMLVMVFSIPLYSDAIYPDLEEALGPFGPIFRWVAFAATLPVLGLLGLPLALNVARARFAASVDALVLMGVTAAIAVSTAHLARGEGEVYFETASMLLVLLTGGRALEATARGRAARAFRGLLELSPERALKVTENAQNGTEIAVDEIAPGDVVRVRAGERFPIDGQVVSGSASVDRALVTGESALEPVTAGARVHAGTLNIDGLLDVRAERAVGARLLDRVAELLDQARHERGRASRLADRIARWFIPLTVTVALATLLAWWPRVGAVDSLMIALSTILIACPCALGIAAPIAIWSGIREAARHGALVRSPEAFETLARDGIVALDKTGTVTFSTPELLRVTTSDSTTEAEALRVAGSLAVGSDHPYSRMVVAAMRSRDIVAHPARDVRVLGGLGIEGVLPEGRVRLGRPAFVAGDDGGHQTDSSELSVGIDGRILASFESREAVRPETATAIARLRDLGYGASLVSGDAPEKCRAVGDALGIEVFPGLLPEEKVHWVRERKREGATLVMVGDGLNDAAVLAAADVGIAVGTGAAIARDAASIVLLGSEHGASLTAIPELVRISRRTLRRMRFNLAWAFGYNVVGMGIAAAGYIHPLFAALIMVASSLFVTGSALQPGRTEAARSTSPSPRPSGARTPPEAA